MDIQSLAIFGGTLLGWFVLTVFKNPTPETAKAQAYNKATVVSGGGGEHQAETLRQSVDAMLASTSIADRLLRRIELLETNQSENEGKFDRKLSEMEKKIEELTEDNTKKTKQISVLERKVEFLRRKLFEETGIELSTSELDELIADNALSDTWISHIKDNSEIVEEVDDEG